MSDELNFVLQARREKLEALEAAGVQPYAYSFDRQHTAADAQNLLGKAEEGPPRNSRRANRRVAVAWQNNFCAPR